jgi:hypothetical protein
MSWWHGSNSVNSILAEGVDFEHPRVSDAGDLGWGFYLSGDVSRARAYGSGILRVFLHEDRFAYLDNPYFLNGLDEVEPKTEVELAFWRLAFKDGRMRTCAGADRKTVARSIRNHFVSAGFDGIITPHSGGEAVVFTADGILGME